MLTTNNNLKRTKKGVNKLKTTKIPSNAEKTCKLDRSLHVKPQLGK